MPTLPQPVRTARTWVLFGLMLTAPIFALQAAADPPPPPVLIGPNGNTTDPRPVYYWNVAAGATSYFLEVNSATAIVWHGGLTAEQFCSGATCAASPHSPPGSPLALGQYTWSVKAQNASGGTWSGTMAFTVQPLPAPVALSPNGPMTAFTPAYRWTPSLGATSYFFRIQNPDGSSRFQDNYAASGNCSGTECVVSPPIVLAAGAYTWEVQAKNQPSGGTWSNDKAFTVFGCGGEVKTGDFNGDGRADRLCSGEGGVFVSLATATGFATGAAWLGQPIATPLVGDFDSDGRSDVAKFDSSTGTFSVALSSGSSFGALQSWGTATAGGSTCMLADAKADVGDFNGDGRTDVSCKMAHAYPLVSARRYG